MPSYIRPPLLAAIILLPFWALAQAAPVTTSAGGSLSAAQLLGQPLLDSTGDHVGVIRDIQFSPALLPAAEGAETTSSPATPELLFRIVLPTDEFALVPASLLQVDSTGTRVRLDRPRSQLRSALAARRSGPPVAQAMARHDPRSEAGQLAGATRWAKSATATEIEAADDGVTGTSNAIVPPTNVPPTTGAVGNAAGVGATAATGPDAAEPQEALAALQRALEADPLLSNVADEVIVAQSGSGYLISGAVQNEAQRERVLELARTHSNGEVRDFLRIRDAAPAE